MTTETPQLNEVDLGLAEVDVDGNGVTYAKVTSPSYGGGSLTWVSGGSAGAVSGLAHVKTSSGSVLSKNNEVHVVMSAPTGTNARGGPILRGANPTGTKWSGYYVRETTAGNATSWEIVRWDGTSVTATLATLSPAGVTGYPVAIKFAAIGDLLMLKVWASGASEPDWGSTTNVVTVTDTTYTGAEAGMAAWGLTASGNKVEWSSLKLRPTSQIAFTNVASVADTASNTNSYSLSNVEFVKNTPHIIFVYNQAGATANAPTVTVPSGVTLSSAKTSSAFSGTNLRRYALYTAQADGTTRTGTVTASFSTQNQTGCSIAVIRVWNGDPSSSNGSAILGTGSAYDVDDPNTTGTSISSSLTFVNPVGTSGTFFVAATAVNAIISLQNGTSIASGNYANPATAYNFGVSVGNATAPSGSWTGTTPDRISIGGEVALSDWYKSEWQSKTGAATLSATGSQTAAGVRKRLGAAALTATGSQTAAGTVTTGSQTVTGAAALTAAGSQTAAGTVTRLGAAALTAAGTQTAAGVRTTAGAAALTATGTAAAAGVCTRQAAATLSATGASTVVGVRTRFGAASLAGAATLTGAGARTGIGAAALAGTGTQTATGVRTCFGAASLSAAGTLSASGTVTTGAQTVTGAAVLTAVSTQTVAGVRTRFAAAALSATSAATAAGTRTITGAATLSAAGSLSATGGRLFVGAATLVSAGSLSAAGVRARLGGAALSSSTGLQAAGTRSALGAAALSGQAALSAVAVRIAFAVGSLQAAGVLDATGVRTRLTAAALLAVGSLTAQGRGYPPEVTRQRGPLTATSTGQRARTVTVGAGGSSARTIGVRSPVVSVDADRDAVSVPSSPSDATTV